MKKTILYSLLLSLLFAGCDIESPMDSDLYPQKVYIVGARDQIIDREIHIGKSPDTINVSVAVSGSRTLIKDVAVTIELDTTAVGRYNSRNLSDDDVQYQQLDSSIYSFPLQDLTIESGSVYNLFPVYVEPETLHCDSLYMLPLTLTSTSEFEIAEDSLVLVRINMVNDYSGLYYIDGILSNTNDPSNFLNYKMPRNLLAVDNGNTVRMFHYNNEVEDYRETSAFKIAVNETDSTISLSTWDQFIIYDGGGTYYPSLELYEFWYEYDNNGERWRAECFMYRERKGNQEQREINDWIKRKRE